ncbi:MAG: site-specific DNA-methyltransferase [Meiothermus sp.]|nr:MAG: site-specific DNA-methyltransferase [Meiothermus sp.]
MERDLLPQVKAAFAEYKTADKTAIEQELAKAIEQARSLGADPETLPKVKELRDRLACESVDIEALEADVYDHLYRFFRRYYHEGDFLSRRVYKEGVYAIPYEGEEVKLYWANHDQYYIKTSESFRDYAFRLQPEDAQNPMRVHFRLVDAAEGEHNNVRETNGKERRFRLAPTPFAALENGELVIRFTFAPDPQGRKQKELNAEVEAAILNLPDPALTDWIGLLSTKHVRTDGTLSESTRLRVHLDRYTARNTFDYFIHKDLGGFLRRELDFYIKNEVMHLDDIESETAPRVEQYLSKIKVIRRIAYKIIDFLAQIEDFQKKLWLKKKFVVETQYCVTLGRIFAIEDDETREWLITQVCQNTAQREEWVRLHAIDALQPSEGGLLEPGKPGYSEPLKAEFLQAYPTLMVDTRHFDEAFKARLLAAIPDIDEETDGLLIHSENFQALNLLQARYREQVKCVYIDPPYNTGNDHFIYKDSYQHSSWLSMMADRLDLMGDLQGDNGVLFVSIDANERDRLAILGEAVLGAECYLNTFVWINNLKGRQISGQGAAKTHEYVLVFGNSSVGTFIAPVTKFKDIMPSAYKGFDYETQEDAVGSYVLKNELWNTNSKFNEETRPNLVFNIHYNFATGEVRFSDVNEEVQFEGFVKIPPRQNNDGIHKYHAWRWGKEKIERNKGDLEFVEAEDRVRIYTKVRGFETTILKDVITDISTSAGGKELLHLFEALAFMDYPKPAALVEVFASQAGYGELIADYFAGSGTTGHAVINLNREDGGRRKFILVEMGDYFDTVLVPRLKKVTFTPEWKDGKPKRLPTAEEIERSPRIFKILRLESYEDTLNNLELRRTEQQQRLLDLPEAQGPNRLREQYILRYMLEVEARGSQSLLNIAAFTDPTAYTLTVKRPGSDESRTVNVDLIETFNYLIGLRVEQVDAPRTFGARFKRDDDPDLPEDAPRRLKLDGRLKEDPAGSWWFRTVTGTMPDGRKTLIIWRNRPGGDTPQGIEQDNLILDEWFQKQGYSSKDHEFDLIYVNGDNNLENLKAPGDTWKVRLIEEEFFRLMFAEEGV